MPGALDGVSVSDLRKVQEEVAKGRWRANAQAKDWVGYAVAAAMGLNAKDKAHRSKISRLLKIWTDTGMFVTVEGRDEKRELRSYVEVGAPAND